MMTTTETIPVSRQLPENNKECLVLVASVYGGHYYTTARYVAKFSERAEDYCDPDVDPDWLDRDEDGNEYAPEGWYETTIEGEYEMKINNSGTVVRWMPLPIITETTP